MSDTYPLELSHLESLFLSDSLSIFTQGPPDAPINHLSPYPTLLLKIGGAVLETEQMKCSARVSMVLAELWMIREVTKSSVVVGSERVGLNLLLKVYEGIRALSAEPDMQSLVSVFGEVLEEEPGKKEFAAQLQRIREGAELESGGSSNEAISEQPSGDDEPGDSDEGRPDHDTATAA